VTSNIKKSEIVIAKILTLLMERGLSHSMMTFRCLGLESEYEPFFKTSFLWLVDEGLVRSKNNIESITSVFHAYDPVLTAKGFALLGTRLTSQDGEITIAQAVEETASSQRSFAGLGDFLGGLLGGFTKSIGN
jgi:hypothetical protein